MKPVYTYKALSNTIFFWGFQPIDFGIGLLSWLMVWGVTNFKVAFIWLCFAYFIGKKLKHRPEGSEKSFLIFIKTPNKLSVNNNDIPNYSRTVEQESKKCRK